jgi:hypothetical protein
MGDYLADVSCKRSSHVLTFAVASFWSLLAEFQCFNDTNLPLATRSHTKASVHQDFGLSIYNAISHQVQVVAVYFEHDEPVRLSHDYIRSSRNRFIRRVHKIAKSDY